MNELLRYSGEDGLGIFQGYPVTAKYGEFGYLLSFEIKQTISQGSISKEVLAKNRIDINYPIISNSDMVLDMIRNPPGDDFMVNMNNFNPHKKVNFGYLLVPGTKYFPISDNLHRDVIPIDFQQHLEHLTRGLNKSDQVELGFDWEKLQSDLQTIPVLRYVNYILDKDFKYISPIALNIELGSMQKDKNDIFQFEASSESSLRKVIDQSNIIDYDNNWVLRIKISNTDILEKFKTEFEIESVEINFNHPNFNIDTIKSVSKQPDELNFQYDNNEGKIVLTGINYEILIKNEIKFDFNIKTEYLLQLEKIEVKTRIRSSNDMLNSMKLASNLRYISPMGLPISNMVLDQDLKPKQAKTGSHLSTLSPVEGQVRDNVGLILTTEIEPDIFLPDILNWKHLTVKLDNTTLEDAYTTIDDKLADQSLESVFKQTPIIKQNKRVHLRHARHYLKLHLKDEIGYLDIRYKQHGISSKSTSGNKDDPFSLVTFSYGSISLNVSSQLANIVTDFTKLLGGKLNE